MPRRILHLLYSLGKVLNLPSSCLRPLGSCNDRPSCLYIHLWVYLEILVITELEPKLFFKIMIWWNKNVEFGEGKKKEWKDKSLEENWRDRSRSFISGAGKSTEVRMTLTLTVRTRLFLKCVTLCCFQAANSSVWFLCREMGSLSHSGRGISHLSGAEALMGICSYILTGCRAPFSSPQVK